MKTITSLMKSGLPGLPKKRETRVHDVINQGLLLADSPVANSAARVINEAVQNDEFRSALGKAVEAVIVNEGVSTVDRLSRQAESVGSKSNLFEIDNIGALILIRKGEGKKALKRIKAALKNVPKQLRTDVNVVLDFFIGATGSPNQSRMVRDLHRIKKEMKETAADTSGNPFLEGLNAEQLADKLQFFTDTANQALPLPFRIPAKYKKAMERKIKAEIALQKAKEADPFLRKALYAALKETVVTFLAPKVNRGFQSLLKKGLTRKVNRELIDQVLQYNKFLAPGHIALLEDCQKRVNAKYKKAKKPVPRAVHEYFASEINAAKQNKSLDAKQVIHFINDLKRDNGFIGELGDNPFGDNPFGS